MDDPFNNRFIEAQNPVKFRSCMTLFCRVSAGPNIFEDALKRYFSGQQDPLTLGRIPEAG